jgi:FKBP-type peptidyl-prolyl cis-trans isomerase SlyD
MTDSTTIADGSVVTIHYTLTIDGGQVVDSSEGRDPLAYLHGASNIVPGLENALTGKAAGESLQVTVEPAEGYGERIEEAMQTVPRDRFPGGEDLQPGLQFQATNEDGMAMIGTITGVTDSEVQVDFNHPLAGVTLNFAVEIVEIRDATAEEKEHGHVHGPGGHEH